MHNKYSKGLLVLLGTILALSSCSQSPSSSKSEESSSKSESSVQTQPEISLQGIKAKVKGKAFINKNDIGIVNQKRAKFHFSVAPNFTDSGTLLNSVDLENLETHYLFNYKEEGQEDKYALVNESDFTIENKMTLDQMCSAAGFCNDESNGKFIKRINPEGVESYYLYDIERGYPIPQQGVYISDYIGEENYKNSNFVNSWLKNQGLVKLKYSTGCPEGQCDYYIGTPSLDYAGPVTMFENVSDIKHFFSLVDYEKAYFSKNSLFESLQEIKNKSDELKSESEEETIKNVYTWILKKYKYDWDAANSAEQLGSISTGDQYKKNLISFSGIDILKSDKGVCQAFAHLMSLTLYFSGVKDKIAVVTGSATHAPSHAWNQIGDKSYDVTWDIIRKDKGYGVRYAYFGSSDATFNGTHQKTEER